MDDMAGLIAAMDQYILQERKTRQADGFWVSEEDGQNGQGDLLELTSGGGGAETVEMDLALGGDLGRRGLNGENQGTVSRSQALGMKKGSKGNVGVLVGGAGVENVSTAVMPVNVKKVCTYIYIYMRHVAIFHFIFFVFFKFFLVDCLICE
jgi:hypothetical protein